MSDKTYARVEWTVEDVLSLTSEGHRGEEEIMTTEQATEFLEDEQGRIRDRLIELGWEVMDDLLWDWRQGQKEVLIANQ